MRGPFKPLLITGVLLLVLSFTVVWPIGGFAFRARQESETPLLLYCAAGLKIPAQSVVDAYIKEYDVPLRMDFAGSGMLLSKIAVAQKGDLFLAADESYIDLGRKQGLIAEAIPVARLTPVIAVAKGNPKHIRGVEDLVRGDVRIALGAPEAASVGKTSQRLLESLGQWEQVSAAARARGVFKPTVNEIANDVSLGAVDAGIIWDATAAQYDKIETVPIEGAEDFLETITLGVLSASQHTTAALRFARYLSARDKGLPIFAEHHFPPVEGDVWAEAPEILYFSGGVNRTAIEGTLAQFQEREGCTIKTVFNGCGILVGQMKLGEIPDAYQSCDISFMQDVSPLFQPLVKVSKTDMVIATIKGNPKGIQTLADLGREGLRLGLANEQQSALGALTARLLKAQGLYEQVTKNVVANTPTADLLVSQISTGALDAIVVYRVNTMQQQDKLEVISIDLPEATAVQTYAISKSSEHSQLMARLLERLESAESREHFRESGFDEAAVL